MAVKKSVRKAAVRDVAAEEAVPEMAIDPPAVSAPRRTAAQKIAVPKTHAREAHVQMIRAMRDKVAEALDTTTADVQSMYEAMRTEKEEHERTVSGQKELWRREQEEYTYERDMRRKKEEDEASRRRETDEMQWKNERAAREKILSDRENAIKEREAEIRDFERQVREFPSVLEKALTEAVQRKEGEVRETARIASEMIAKDREREQELSKMKIVNLEETIKRQAAQLAMLERQLQHALERAQSLAVTVIEGSSSKRQDSERPQATSNPGK